MCGTLFLQYNFDNVVMKRFLLHTVLSDATIKKEESFDLLPEKLNQLKIKIDFSKWKYLS